MPYWWEPAEKSTTAHGNPTLAGIYHLNSQQCHPNDHWLGRMCCHYPTCHPCPIPRTGPHLKPVRQCQAYDILNLEFCMLIEMDPVKKAQLQEMMKQMVEQKQILKAKAESSSCEFLSIVSSPIGQLQQTPTMPSTPPGLLRPTYNQPLMLLSHHRQQWWWTRLSEKASHQ